MEIRNSFEVPLSPPEAWRVLMDIPRIAPCMPGAELLEQVDERTYKGKVSVKLGPIALAFVGTAQFEQIDEAAHHARARAQGADAKGRGGANATVDFRLAGAAEGTRVDVTADVNLTGSVAQYGRATGVIQGVATQLINQFAANLERSLSANETRAADRAAAPPERPGEAAGPQAAAPISAFGLMARVVWSAIMRLLGRAPAR
jgi:carbon monoxide dehydrogenase subunit G